MFNQAKGRPWVDIELSFIAVVVKKGFSFFHVSSEGRRRPVRIIKNGNFIHHEKQLPKLLIILVSQRGREFSNTGGFNQWPDCYIVGIL